MEQLNQFLAFQESFRALPIAHALRDNYDIVVYLAFGYCGFVFGGQAFMKDRQPLKLKWLFTLWNFLLASFSIIGAFYVVPHFLRTLFNEGERYIICTHPEKFYLSGPVGLWMTAFILSKIPELVDTVFLVIQKKPVIFLHWYHHTTVMLYCWWAFAYSTPVGIWYAAMNYFVHSIMYTYYFMMNLSGVTRGLVKPIAPVITFLQIAQMVAGLYVAAKSQLAIWAGGECDARPAETRMALVMYFTYFLLFSQLFYKLYLGGGGKGKSKEE